MNVGNLILDCVLTSETERTIELKGTQKNENAEANLKRMSWQL
jgi:hypothetical protein